ncbi:hypothetical protein [Salinilacihabitans rarus]|uniref:hypothetical protein n=1 Tax=Salinilacihabitans rarus TaxID=2961596 RepID=UPI0020C8ADEA|nr:hypothetical protein [Salinilacihabitans rarus]
MLDSGLHTGSTGCLETIASDDANRWELGIIEDEYHDDDEALHLYWDRTSKRSLRERRSTMRSAVTSTGRSDRVQQRRTGD